MRKVLGALKWSLASKIVSTLVQPMTYILIANMVGPSEMGKYSILLMIVTFAQIFWEGGLSKAIIQSEKIDHYAEKTYRTTNLILGTLVSMTLLIFAEQIAVYFTVSEIGLIKLISLVIFLNSLSVYDIASMHKNLNYKELFRLDVYSVLVPSFLALVCVFFVQNIIPLVLILIMTPLIRIFYLKIYLKYQYYFFIHKKTIKQIFSFSLFIQMTLLCSWAYRWFDIFILQKYFSLETIGLFRTSVSLTNSLSALTFAFVVPVAYSYFSNDLEKNKKKISNFVLKYMASIEALGFILFWLFSIVVYTLELYFSSEWNGIASIAVLLFFRELHFRYYALNVEAIRSLGLVRIELTASITQVVIIIAGMIVIPKDTLQQFVTGYALVTILASMLIENIFGIFYLKFPARMILRNLLFSTFLLLLIFLFNEKRIVFFVMCSVGSVIAFTQSRHLIKKFKLIKEN